jgi:UDP-N-acetylglucosamine transferase subunit ALG13/glycosyltransferase involved in cell wall biosynthesis
MNIPATQSRSALLVCSSGGHLAQLLALRPWWASRSRSWVTSDTVHARSALAGERITWGYFPTTRHAWNLIRNSYLATRLLFPRSRRPSVIVSTGAGVAFPFFVLGRLLRIPTVYVEVFGRIDSRTLTGRLCHPFSSLFLVQWPEQRVLYRKAVVAGPLLSPAARAKPPRLTADGAAGAEPLVLVTIGTDHHPFRRLTDWVEQWLADGGEKQARMLIQHGATTLPAGPGRVKQLGYSDLQQALQEASVVVTHAATTAIEARAVGTVPIVVPRRPDLGEHVDDHQLRFARKLRADALAVVCETEQEFRDALDSALAAVPEAGEAAGADGFSGPGNSVSEPTGVGRAAGLIDQLIERRYGVPPVTQTAPGSGEGAASSPLAGGQGGVLERDGWPSVTAVIPTRGDRADLLEGALSSVTSQDYPGRLECLVVLDRPQPVDDGEAVSDPTRGHDPGTATVAAARAMGARVVHNQRTPGLAGARNTGILAAASELVAFCDDDDAWVPGKLRNQVAALASDPAAAIVCCGIAVEYGGSVHERVYPHRTVTLEQLAQSRLASLHPSTFVARRTALLNGVGLVSEEIPGSHAEDYELLLRAARHGPVLNVPDPGVRVRWHRTGPAMQHDWQMVAAALPWLLGHYPELTQTPAGYARIAGKIAFAEAARGNRAGAWTWARRALRTRRAEPRAYLALAVMTGLLSPARVIGALHRFGRGL